MDRTLLAEAIALGAWGLLAGCDLPRDGLGPQTQDDGGVGDAARVMDPVEIGDGLPGDDRVDAAAGPGESDVASGSDGDGGDPDADEDGTNGVVDASDEQDTGSEAAAHPPGPMFVQSGYATPNAAQSVTVAYPAAQAAGDLNVVVVGWNDSTTRVRSVSDMAGNVYAVAVGPTIATNFFTQTIYYAKNVAFARANAVAIQFDGPARFPDVRVLEYAGIDMTSPFDVGAGAAGSSAATRAGPVITSAAGLLVAANTVLPLTTGAGPGFTLRILTNPDGNVVEDRVAAVPGSYDAVAPMNAVGPWVMQIAAFRAR